MEKRFLRIFFISTLVSFFTSCTVIRTKASNQGRFPSSVFKSCPQGLNSIAKGSLGDSFKFDARQIKEITKAVKKYKLPYIPFLKDLDPLEQYTLIRAIPEALTNIYRLDSLYSGRKLKRYYDEIGKYVISEEDNYYKSLNNMIFSILKKNNMTFDEYLRLWRTQYIKLPVPARESVRRSLKKRITQFSALKNFVNLKFKLKKAFLSSSVNILNIGGKMHNLHLKKTSIGSTYIVEVRVSDIVPVYREVNLHKKIVNYSYEDERTVRGVTNRAAVGLDGKFYLLNPGKRFNKIGEKEIVYLNIGEKLETIGLHDYFKIKEIEIPNIDMQKIIWKDRKKLEEVLPNEIKKDLLFPLRELK